MHLINICFHKKEAKMVWVKVIYHLIPHIKNLLKLQHVLLMTYIAGTKCFVCPQPSEFVKIAQKLYAKYGIIYHPTTSVVLFTNESHAQLLFFVFCISCSIKDLMNNCSCTCYDLFMLCCLPKPSWKGELSWPYLFGTYSMYR